MRIKPGIIAGVLSLVATGIHAEGITATQILIGQTAGFTGTVAGGVKETTDGAKLYLDWINSHGGVNGRKIILESLDDGFDPKRAGENARKLIEERDVFAMFLCRGTPHAEAVIPHLKAKGVPLVGPSTGAELLHTPVNHYVFNVRAKYQLEAEKAIVQLSTMGINKIGVIYVQDSFGKDAFEGAQKGFKAANLQPVSVSTYDRTTSKVDGAVQELLKTNPQAGILFGSGSAIADVVHQVRKAGSTMQLVTISNNSSGAFVKSLGQNANGVIVTQVFPNPKMTTTRIATELLKLSRDKPDFVVSHQAMEGYAAAKVLVEGLKRAGKNPTRESFIAALEKMRDYDLGGLTVGYSPTDHTGIEYVELSIIGKRGDFVQR